MGAGDTTARDFKLDASGDLAFEGGDLVLEVGVASIASDLHARLQTFRGEWFLDGSIGIPFFDQVLVKQPNMTAIRALLRTEILDTPGIADVLELTTNYDNATRTLALSFRATTDTGEIIAEAVEVRV